MRQIVKTAKLMRNSMHIAEVRVIKRHSGKKLRIYHLLACFHILTVGNSTRQKLRDNLHCLNRASIRNRCCRCGHIGFNGMSQSIETSCCCKKWRHFDHKNRIINGKQRSYVLIDNRHFNLARSIRNNRKPCHFTRSSCCSIDCD
ncbi:hypothetical protein D3C73_1119350 [compost metagenome]